MKKRRLRKRTRRILTGCIILALLFGVCLRIANEESASDPPQVKTAVQEKKEAPVEPPSSLPKQSKESTPKPNEPDDSIEAPSEPSKAVLSFAGDVMFSAQYLAAYDQHGVTALADESMLSHMREADLFLLNEEFPFSLQGEAMDDKEYTFRVDPAYVKIFQDLGADIVTVANNHALDFGKEAFCDTLDTLKQAEIGCIGGGYTIQEASAPAVRTVNGQTFAIFGATRVSPSYDWYATDSTPGLFQTYDPAKLNAAIQEAASVYDHIIVFVHWGIERSETPEDYQRALAKGYIDAGADLVVGCHPHVLQGFEYYSGVPIIYSLGNYLFGNRGGETLLLEASFSMEDPVSLKLIPCKRTDGVLSQMQNPAFLFRHLTELSFDVSVTPEGILTP